MSKKSKAAKKKLALKKRRRKEFKTFLVSLIILVVIAALARLVVFDTVRMNSDAMSPVYQAGDTVFVNKLTLWKSFDIGRGDRVYAVLDGDMKLVRTVYGLPGDLIDVREDGGVTLTVENTVPYMSYGIDGGLTPSELNIYSEREAIDGKVGRPIQLETRENSPARFFKIVDVGVLD